jgi:hypothetical protein
MIEGFKKQGDEVTMVPIMRNLWAFDWKCYHCGWKKYQGPTPEKCPQCGKKDKLRKKLMWIGKDNPQSTSYCFDSEPHFQYLIKNRSNFEKSLGAGKVSEKVDNIILKDLAYASYDSETERLDMAKMKSFGLQYLPEFEVNKAVALFQANELMRRNDSLGYVKAIINYFDEFPSSNGFLLTNLSQGISELTDEPQYLIKALEYAVKAIDHLKSENCYLVAASIAMQLQNTTKAIEILSQAQDQAKIEKKSFKTVNLFLDELKSN